MVSQSGVVGVRSPSCLTHRFEGIHEGEDIPCVGASPIGCRMKGVWLRRAVQSCPCVGMRIRRSRSSIRLKGVIHQLVFRIPAHVPHDVELFDHHIPVIIGAAEHV